MSETKFTPGPWKITGDSGRLIEQDGNDEADLGSIFAELWSNVGTRHNQKANAALIAAAPEMYESLQLCVTNLRMCCPCPSGAEFCDNIEKMLKKARGE